MRRILERPADLNPRFVEGTAQELEELFGSPLPELPGGQVGTGETQAPLVDLYPGLRSSLREAVDFIYGRLVAKATPKEMAEFDREGGETPFARAEQVLETLLTTILEQERRLGLLNLFWLAHSKDAADLFHEHFSNPGTKINIKYQMFPLIRGIYRNAYSRVVARMRGRQGNMLRRNLGADFNGSLIDSIIDDLFPLTEVSLSRLNLSEALTESNKRFRLTFREYREIYAVCRERLREGIQRREARLLDLLRRHLPSIRPEACDDERSATRVLFNSAVLRWLLNDVAGVGSKLADNKVLSSSLGPRRDWSDLLQDYYDLVRAIKRSEIVDLLRQRVTLVGPQHDELEMRARYDEGRLFRFHPDSDVMKLARKVTVIFADLRGFTRTSEGGVSEQELTQRLYAVFDPLAAIVEQHHGRIDKFTGDGVMITFGLEGVGRDDELNALRTALAIRQMTGELRATGRTQFEMGISVHTGRAQIAHFVLDDRNMDRTVIGRNVNIAGRLSGSGKTQAGAFEGEDVVEAASSTRASKGATLDVLGGRGRHPVQYRHRRQPGHRRGGAPASGG